MEYNCNKIGNKIHEFFSKSRERIDPSPLLGSKSQNEISRVSFSE